MWRRLQFIVTNSILLLGVPAVDALLLKVLLADERRVRGTHDNSLGTDVRVVLRVGQRSGHAYIFVEPFSPQELYQLLAVCHSPGYVQCLDFSNVSLWYLLRKLVQRLG